MTLFRPATKHQIKLRLALIGVSGSGKTYSALAIAVNLGARVALIDTERGSASLYSGKFKFDTIVLDEVFGDFSPESYVKAIHAAEAEGYDVIVIDSLSHAWSGKGGALEMHDVAMDRQKTKNNFTAWREVTAEHNALVDAMIQCKAHLIVTMRAKTEYVQEKDKDNRTTVRKVGMQPVQRDGLEFEFDLVADMDDAKMIVSKTRFDKLHDAVIQKPNGNVSNTLKAWLAEGTLEPERPVQPATTDAPADTRKGAQARILQHAETAKDIVSQLSQANHEEAARAMDEHLQRARTVYGDKAATIGQLNAAADDLREAIANAKTLFVLPV